MAFFNRIPGADRYSAGENAAAEGTVQQEMNRARRNGRRDLILCLIIIVVALFIQESRDPRAVTIALTQDETTFSVVGMDGTKHTFAYKDAESVEIYNNLDAFDRGEMVSGEENRKFTSGTFRNSLYGEYELHVSNRLDYYLVVHTPDGVLVFNLESNDTTKAMYEYISGLAPAN